MALYRSPVQCHKKVVTTYTSKAHARHKMSMQQIRFDTTGRTHFWPQDHDLKKLSNKMATFWRFGGHLGEEDVLRICAIFRRRPSRISDDIHFNKFEKASPKNHNCEVWPSWTKRFVWRRIFKSLLKERHFYLLAAILDDVIIRFQQKLHQSDRLINIFNLVYDMTIFGQKSNLTPIWPPGYYMPIIDPRVMILTTFERALSIDHSYQVSKKSGWRFVGKRCFKNLCYV